MTTLEDIVLANLPAFDGEEVAVQVMDDASTVMATLYFQQGVKDLTDFLSDCTDESSVCTVANYNTNYDGTYMAVRPDLDDMADNSDTIMWCFEADGQCWLMQAAEGLGANADATFTGTFSASAPDYSDFTYETLSDLPTEYRAGFDYPGLSFDIETPSLRLR